MEFLEELLDKSFCSLEDLANSVHAETGVSVAIFDDVGQILAVSDKANGCKCYFLKNGRRSICSLFIPEFVSKVMKGEKVEKKCENMSRLTTKCYEINEKRYTITLFQYNLPTDNSFDIDRLKNMELEFEKAFELDISLLWQPAIISLKERTFLFNFVYKHSKEILQKMQ
jgi:hypothetical protein